jgi:hypothetical protein
LRDWGSIGARLGKNAGRMRFEVQRKPGLLVASG